MFRFDFRLDDSDYLAFNRYHVETSPEGKKALRVLRLYLPLLFFLMALASYLIINRGF